MNEIKDILTIYYDGEGYVCHFARTKVSSQHRQEITTNVDYLDEVLRFVRINFSESEVIACEVVNHLLMGEIVHYEKVF